MNFQYQLFEASTNQYFLFGPSTTPSIWSPAPSSYQDEDQSSNQSRSSSISPYGSPPQVFMQHLNHFNTMPTPIARPTNHFNTKLVQPTVQQLLPKRSEQVDMTDYIRRAHGSNNTRTRHCTFCKSNGENEIIYSSHSLKNSVNKISCPILMKYTCVECGASGENTHTIKYCPVMQKKIRRKMLDKLTMSSN